MSDSVRPHRRQPTRLRCPWDSPGKNTGVGCHFLLQCIKVKVSCSVVSDSSGPMDFSPPGSSIHGIFLGKSTGVGCHCLLRVVTRSMEKKKKKLHVTQSERSTYERLILRSRHFEGDDEDATRPKGGTVIRTSWPAPHADFPEVLD